MVKMFFRFLVIFACMAGWSSAYGEIKIGFVNVAGILKQSPQAKQSQEALQKEFSQREKQLVKQQKKLLELEKKYQKEAAVMSSSRRKEQEQDILQERRLFQRMKRDFDEDLNLRRNEELQALQVTVAKTIDNFAKTNKFDLIVNEGVVYAGKEIDISIRILDELKKLAK